VSHFEGVVNTQPLRVHIPTCHFDGNVTCSEAETRTVFRSRSSRQSFRTLRSRKWRCREDWRQITLVRSWLMGGTKSSWFALQANSTGG